MGTCRIHGCSRSSKARELCAAHYQRDRNTGNPELDGRRKPRQKRPCLYIGCLEHSFSRGYCRYHYNVAKRDRLFTTPSSERVCSVDACGKWHHSAGFCAMHYERARNNGTLTGVPRVRCRVSGCTSYSGNQAMCAMHMSRFRRTGTTDLPLKQERQDSARWVNASGYVVVFRPGHPNCFDKSRGTALEHRLVMSDAMKRPLTNSETVHHKNGDRTDNRIENLELWSSRNPKGQRIPDKIEYALEILRMYAPGLLSDGPETGGNS